MGCRFHECMLLLAKRFVSRCAKLHYSTAGSYGLLQQSLVPTNMGYCRQLADIVPGCPALLLLEWGFGAAVHLLTLLGCCPSNSRQSIL